MKQLFHFGISLKFEGFLENPKFPMLLFHDFIPLNKVSSVNVYNWTCGTSDSKCNQNSPLCLCCFEVRLLQLSPFWLTSTRCV